MTLCIEWDVVTRDVFRPSLVCDEIVQRAFVASMRTKRIPVIQAGKGVLEDRDGKAKLLYALVSTLLEEIQFIAENIENISLDGWHILASLT
jgi:hypothetical protein